jgi:hypothetical protein
MSGHKIENECVVDIVQASLGLINQDIKAIWFTIEGKLLNITFVVNNKDSEVMEDIEDIIFELEALQVGVTDIETEHQVLEYNEYLFPPENSRRVYIAKNYSE